MFCSMIECQVIYKYNITTTNFESLFFAINNMCQIQEVKPELELKNVMRVMRKPYSKELFCHKLLNFAHRKDIFQFCFQFLSIYLVSTSVYTIVYK